MPEEQKVPPRLVRAIRAVDVIGFGGGAVLLVVLADQLDFLAMPKSLFWALYAIGVILVAFAVLMHYLIEQELRAIERKSRRNL